MLTGYGLDLDNTNADPDTRAIWINLAKKHNIPARCVWFRTPMNICEHNDAVRSLNKTVRSPLCMGLMIRC